MSRVCNRITLDIILSEPMDQSMALTAAQRLATRLGPLIVGGTLPPSTIVVDKVWGSAHIEDEEKGDS